MELRRPKVSDPGFLCYDCTSSVLLNLTPPWVPAETSETCLQVGDCHQLPSPSSSPFVHIPIQQGRMTTLGRADTSPKWRGPARVRVLVETVAWNSQHPGLLPWHPREGREECRRLLSSQQY